MQNRSTKFLTVFKNLRQILQSHSRGLVVSSDKPGYFCLDVRISPKFRKSFPIAWVKISKSYVGFHFMPIYFSPVLRESLSPELKARMHGKSCFNFNKVDELLFRELDQLTKKGFRMSKKAGVF